MQINEKVLNATVFVGQAKVLFSFSKVFLYSLFDKKLTSKFEEFVYY